MKRSMSSVRTTERSVLRAQSGYYLVTGLWAVTHRRSFEAVSGAKTDFWLVRMVGALTAATAAALFSGTRAREVSPETRVLSLATAASFAAVDGYYGWRGRISKVYWADLVLQVSFISLTSISWKRRI
jgi:hypothetical protein